MPCRTRSLSKPMILLFLSGLALFLVACVGAIETPIPQPEEEATDTPIPPPKPISSITPLLGRVRRAVVAGSWYPGEPGELARQVDGMLDAVEPVDGAPIALVVPHAGYAYSAQVAATGFKQLGEGEYDVAVIVASDHQMPLSRPISLWAEGGFETPLGVVPVDTEICEALLAADPRIRFDPEAHEGEHPIEIELPFLQRVCPDCRIVPLLMGTDDEDTVEALAQALLQVLPGRRGVVIASSDLSHYPSYDQAIAVDSATLGAIETGDPARLRETTDGLMAAGVPNLVTCACGQGPILVAMRVAQGLGADTFSVLAYANSGQTPGGDRSRVVGYGAVMLWRYQRLGLSGSQRAELLALAREAIQEYLSSKEIPEHHTDDTKLTRRSGAFVTLNEGENLRGCIGHLRADKPLHVAVQEMAVSAATADPRFPTLTPEGLEGTHIEISVLSPLRRVTDLGRIEVGTHGLVIVRGQRQGVLLPQVAGDRGWGRDEFLENLCRNASLPPDCWTRSPTVYAFTAEVFGE